jgi:NADH:ubiquinone oxidoreductase subunit F (NADH-binding)
VGRLLVPGGPAGLEAHLARFGPLPRRVDVTAAAEQAGLRGRGGAAFPTSVKLAAVARRRRPVVVANGTEGEPLSAKDKTLLVTAPHLVLDGVVLAASAVGAHDAVVCVERTATRVIAVLEGALTERHDPVTITLAETPSRYVVGEETALIHWLNGGDAKPTTVPPRPFERGVNGRPTLVQNVETLAHLALIARFGPSWFRSRGTPQDPGTTLVTIGGGVAKPGVYEVEQGSALLPTLHAAGLPDGPPPPVLVGGYFGTWLGPSAVATADLGQATLRGVGASFGCGVLWALPADGCGLAESARVAHWFADQSAGQCGPCVNGLPAIAGTLDALVAGRNTGAAVEHLGRYAALVMGRGACHHPDGAARLVTSAVQVFGDEIERHARLGPCPATARPALPTPRGGSWR